MSKKDLEALAGKKFAQKELEEALMYVKAEIDSAEGDAFKVDVKETNRPDLWSAEGVARELRARIGRERGIPQYRLGKSGLVVTIEKSVKEVRPLTVCAVVKGVRITEPALVQLIQLQEKVALTFGRRRKEAAIGIYDYGKIRGNIRYYGANPKEKKFVPLECKVEMSLEEILEAHPKGKEFAGLLKGKKLYPIFEDAGGEVLSMPPIINSNYSGKVTERTRDLFIEVSGFGMETISAALNVIVMALADRGGKIETVTVVDADGKKFATPKFGTKKITADIAYLKRVSGIELKDSEIISLLERARYEVKKSGNKLLLEYPDYRPDVFHACDVAEDLLIGYGYNRIRPQRPEMAVTGEERKETAYLDKVRDVCVGMGLQEVLTFVLTSKEKQGGLAGMQGAEYVEIANPVSANWSVMRRNIFPELLEFLSKNKHVEYPQNIFEVGKTAEPDSSSATKVKERNKVCAILCGKGYGFTQIKSGFEALCREMQKKCTLKEASHPALKEGRCAEISGDSKGFIGELKEEAAKRFGIGQPAALLEMEL